MSDDYITRFGAQLAGAAQRELPRPKPRRVRQLVLAAGVVVLIGGVVAAATYDRAPRGARHHAPAASRQRAAPRLYDELGVLRRAQTPEDRGPQAEYALSITGRQDDTSAELARVRFVRTGPSQQGVVLIPADSHQGVASQQRLSGPAVCMFRADYDHGSVAGGGLRCSDAHEVETGFALSSLGGTTDMIVPDTVARLESTTRSGRTTTVIPKDNIASWDGGRPRAMRWFDRAGRQITSFTYR